MTYRIKNWDRVFEKADTRQCKRMLWTAMPNKHDGKSYRRLMRADPAHYLAWTLIVQLASKCPVRGVLADEDGPLTPEDMYIKTDCPAEVFQNALPMLVQIGWLSKVEDATSTPPPLRQHSTTTSALPAGHQIATASSGLQDRTLQDITNYPPLPPADAGGGGAAEPEVQKQPQQPKMPDHFSPAASITCLSRKPLNDLHPPRYHPTDPHTQTPQTLKEQPLPVDQKEPPQNDLLGEPATDNGSRKSVTEFQEAWEHLPSPFPKVKVWSPKRMRVLKSRIIDPFFAAHWREALELMQFSAFCRGEQPKTNWYESGRCADLEFFLRPDTVAKLMEGRFSDRNPPASTARKKTQGEIDMEILDLQRELK